MITSTSFLTFSNTMFVIWSTSIIDCFRTVKHCNWLQNMRSPKRYMKSRQAKNEIDIQTSIDPMHQTQPNHINL